MQLVRRLVIGQLLLTAAACSGDLGTVAPSGGGGNTGGVGGGSGVDAGVSASGRVTAGLEALYTFDEGVGAVVRDKAGGGALMDLNIENPGAVTWIPGGGLIIDAPTTLSTAGPATQIASACQLGNAITIETWTRTAAVNQAGPARVVTVANDTNNANLMLGQAETLAEVRLRTTETDNSGTPATLSEINAFTGQTVHIAYTRSGIDDEADVWIDGQLAGSTTVAGNLSNWDSTYRLAVANDISGDRPWRGEIYLVAIYCRDLSAAEIWQNYEAGY